jgi:hypothetical protein
MKQHHYFILAFALLSMPLTLPANAGQCPDYAITDAAPAAPNPSQAGFRKWTNAWLSAWYTPYHMVHDQIVAAGSTATVVGKFDYDWVMHKDLEGEYIHAYLYGTGMSEWEYLGRYTTNGDGKIYVPVSARAEGDYIVRMVVEGDLSSATGYLTVASMDRQTILFDIDGTLTLNDFEAVGDYLGTDRADNHPYAVEVVSTYIDRGYQVIYLTGRPYWVGKNTRAWFDYSAMKPWHLHTNPNSDNLLDMQTQTYKTNYIDYLKNTVGLNIVRAYGNAQTDINAYADAGIDASETYIIGANAGNNGTQPLTGGYEDHYYNVVLNQPAANCTTP